MKHTLIHINRKHIDRNRKEGKHLPVFSARQGASILYAWSVRMQGIVSGLYQPETPLSCGATAWLRVEDGVVVLLDRGGNPFPGLTFQEAESFECPINPAECGDHSCPQPSTSAQWQASSPTHYNHPQGADL